MRISINKPIFVIVIAIAVFIAMQVVDAQNNESETAKTKVDKLIEDTKRENTTKDLYRAELIQRMQNTTCLNTNLEGIGSVPLYTDILKTSELEGLLKTCVREGLINQTETTFVMMSESMKPFLKPYDILTVSNSTSFDNLKIGDVIVFRASEAKTDDGKPKVIVHRIVDIGTFYGQKVLKAKGDANPYSIPGLDFPIFKENYIGSRGNGF